MESVMPGGGFADPIRRAEGVERTAGPGSVNVQALLRHFEGRGCTLTPRVVEGRAAAGRELLTFIEGEAAYPPYPPVVRGEETLTSVARAIRTVHDAAAGFTPPEKDGWWSHEAAMPSAPDCVGHRDLGPWNFVYDGTDVAGIIDWDFAGPTTGTWDLAYAAHHFVPLHPTEHLASWGWDEEPDRAARLRLFAAAYGSGVDPAELVDLAIVRMTAVAARIEAEVRAGNPAYSRHRDEGHAAGYREAARFIIGARSRLVS